MSKRDEFPFQKLDGVESVRRSFQAIGARHSAERVEGCGSWMELKGRLFCKVTGNQLTRNYF